MSDPSTRCIGVSQPVDGPKEQLRIFCFAHAGATASVYGPLSRRYGSPHVEILPVERAGRGRRFREAPPKCMADIVEDFLTSFQAQLSGSPVVLFGHSIGGLVAASVASALSPSVDLRGLAIVASPPPGAMIFDDTERLSDFDLVQFVGEAGALPAKALESRDILTILVSRLRTDIALASSVSSDIRIDAPVWVFAGSEDKISPKARMNGWKSHCRAGYQLMELDGGHFVIEEGLTATLRFLAADDLAYKHRSRVAKPTPDIPTEY